MLRFGEGVEVFTAENPYDVGRSFCTIRGLSICILTCSPDAEHIPIIAPPIKKQEPQEIHLRFTQAKERSKKEEMEEELDSEEEEAQETSEASDSTSSEDTTTSEEGESPQEGEDQEDAEEDQGQTPGHTHDSHDIDDMYAE